MMISTNGQQIVDEPKINANLAVIENKNESNYKIGIEIRGSSSQMFPKNHTVLKQEVLTGQKILM